MALGRVFLETRWNSGIPRKRQLTIGIFQLKPVEFQELLGNFFDFREASDKTRWRLKIFSIISFRRTVNYRKFLDENSCTSRIFSHKLLTIDKFLYQTVLKGKFSRRTIDFRNCRGKTIDCLANWRLVWYRCRIVWVKQYRYYDLLESKFEISISYGHFYREASKLKSISTYLAWSFTICN